MRKTKPSVFKAALLFFVISVILSILISYLSGYDRFAFNMSNLAEELAQNPEMMSNPTEEYIEEFATKFEAAVPVIAPSALFLIGVLLIMTGLISAGFEGYCLKVSRLEETKAKDIMCSFEYFGKALIIFIVRSIATAIGLCIFVFPGIILHYAYSQSFKIMYDHPEYSAFKCLSTSAKLMKGRKLVFFSLQVSFLFWYLMEVIVAIPVTLGTLIIGLPVLTIYTKPFMGLTYAHFYNSLIEPVPQPEINL